VVLHGAKGFGLHSCRRFGLQSGVTKVWRRRSSVDPAWSTLQGRSVHTL